MDFQVKVVLTCLLFTPKTFPGAFQWLPGPNSVIDSPVGALRWTQFWKRFGKVLSSISKYIHARNSVSNVSTPFKTFQTKLRKGVVRMLKYFISFKMF